jgi:membrane associated rhomboid family serine protease
MFPLKDEIKSYSFPIVSYLIILINSIVYVYHYFIYPNPEEFIYKYGFIPSNVNFLNIITAMFLHGGFFFIYFQICYFYLFLEIMLKMFWDI